MADQLRKVLGGGTFAPETISALLDQKIYELTEHAIDQTDWMRDHLCQFCFSVIALTADRTEESLEELSEYQYKHRQAKKKSDGAPE